MPGRCSWFFAAITLWGMAVIAVALVMILMELL